MPKTKALGSEKMKNYLLRHWESLLADSRGVDAASYVLSSTLGPRPALARRNRQSSKVQHILDGHHRRNNRVRTA